MDFWIFLGFSKFFEPFWTFENFLIFWMFWDLKKNFVEFLDLKKLLWLLLKVTEVTTDHQ